MPDYRVDVLGVGISITSPAHTVSKIQDWLGAGKQHYVCVTGVHGVMESQRDPGLLGIHNESGLTVPDGVPMVWALHYAGAREAERVYGPDMMLDVCARAAEHGWSCYFYGGGSGTAACLANRLVERFPQLAVAGTCSPPFRDLTVDEDTAFTDEIRESGADLVFVGLSTPKQERWMATHVERFSAPCVLLGVGAAFDIHADQKRDAPRWMRRIGMHWLFRLIQEPKRLWRRYARNNPVFLLSIMRRRPRLVETTSLRRQGEGRPAAG